MKKTHITYLFFLLLPVKFTLAQADPFERTKMRINNVKSVKDFKIGVDFNGNFSEEGQVGCLSYGRKFDKKGNIKKRIVFNCDSTVEQEYIYTYNENNEEIEWQWLMFNSWSNDTTKGLRHTFQYDKEGKIKTEIVYNADNSLFSSIDWSYIYEEKKIKKKVSYCRQCNGIRTKIFEYDKKGNLIQVTELAPDSSLITKLNYSYDTKRNIKEKITKTTDSPFEELDEPLKTITRYKYNNVGKLIETLELKFNSKDFQNKVTYVYDEKGLLIKEYIFYKPNKVRLMTRYEYEFYN